MSNEPIRYCNRCFQEVEETSGQWRHVNDQTPLCPHSLSIYPEQLEHMKRSGIRPQAPKRKPQEWEN